MAEHIIVYRNPMEAAMWDFLTNTPAILYVIGLLAIVLLWACVLSLADKRIGMCRDRYAMKLKYGRRSSETEAVLVECHKMRRITHAVIHVVAVAVAVTFLYVMSST